MLEMVKRKHQIFPMPAVAIYETGLSGGHFLKPDHHLIFYRRLLNLSVLTKYVLYQDKVWIVLDGKPMEDILLINL